jgi:hypothetical protein
MIHGGRPGTYNILITHTIMPTRLQRLQQVEVIKMNTEHDVKVEGSLPVQARVNIVSLANLDLYWASEGYQIRTVSQLIGFNIELLVEILKANGKLDQQVSTISNAHKYLISRGLYQKSMHDRGHKKLGMAIAFEGMRAEGMRPESYAPGIYNRLHRGADHSGEPSTVQPFTGKVSNPILDRATEIYNNLKDEDVTPFISQEFAMRDKVERVDSGVVVKNEDAAEYVRVARADIDEPPVLKEKGNSKEQVQARIRYADEQSKRDLEALNNFDPMEAMSRAKKD